MPVASPSLLQLGLEAAAKYPLHDPTLTYISDTDNDVFRVDDGAKVYALRLQWVEDNDIAGVESELRWLTALREETRVVAPLPVASKHGEWVVDVDDPDNEQHRPCTLLEWIPGEIVDEHLTTAHLHKVGELMAELHDHASQRASSLALDARRTAFECDLVGVMAKNDIVHKWFDRDALALINTGAERIQCALQSFSTHARGFSFIHGDLHHWNYFFDAGQIRVIDFADSGWGHFSYDMAVTLSSLRYAIPGLPDHAVSYAAFETAFFEGYARRRTLAPNHELMLETYTAARLLFITEVILTHWWDPQNPTFGQHYVQTLPSVLESYLSRFG